MKKEDIEFTTDKGTQMRLVFEKPEYRAYKKSGSKWEKTKWGSCLPAPLQKFLTERE